MKRRRAASWRLPILDSGRSDPWRHDEPPATDHQLDAWLAAVAHLDERGTPGIVPASVLLALRGRAA
ncbi:hypothetical protein [Mycobacterium sp.]|uniref:hypothetical protein n=1 Tax=Mycobacterium sp. TaxID=1785 RepID=UPI003BB1C257